MVSGNGAARPWVVAYTRQADLLLLLPDLHVHSHCQTRPGTCREVVGLYALAAVSVRSDVVGGRLKPESSRHRVVRRAFSRSRARRRLFLRRGYMLCRGLC